MLLSHPYQKVTIYRCYIDCTSPLTSAVSDYCCALFCSLKCAQRFHYRALGSSRRQEGATEHLIGGSKKRLKIAGRALNSTCY